MKPAPSTSMNLAALLAADPELLARFLDTVGDALFVVDADQNITYWNHQAELLTGFSAEEVIGRHCLSGMRCERCLYECNLFERKTIDGARISLRAKDGRDLEVRKTDFVLEDDKGNTVGGIEFLRDETELTQRIQDCRNSRLLVEDRERLQAAILGSVREGVLTIDPELGLTVAGIAALAAQTVFVAGLLVVVQQRKNPRGTGRFAKLTQQAQHRNPRRCWHLGIDR